MKTGRLCSSSIVYSTFWFLSRFALRIHKKAVKRNPLQGVDLGYRGFRLRETT